MRRRWFVKHEQSLLFARVGKKSLKTKIDVSAALTSIFFYFLNNFFTHATDFNEKERLLVVKCWKIAHSENKQN